MKIPRTGLVPRKEYVRDVRLFVVATEGEKTEKQYLSIFRNRRVHVEVLPTGVDGMSAARHVLERLLTFKDQYDIGPDDELWLMIDVDHQRPQFLKGVTQMALESGCRLAVSNPCFELWLLLHFHDHDEAHRRCADVEAQLRLHLGSYTKNWLNLPLFTRVAIERAVHAARSLDIVDGLRWPEYPGTHVYKLMENLLEFWPVGK